MAKAKRFEYYTISRFSNLAEIEFADIKEYLRILDAIQSKIIFCERIAGEPAQTHFYCRDGNTLYILRNQLYQSIEDYEDALDKGFPGAAEYYEAAELGFKNFKEFEACRTTGVADKKKFEKVRNGGFIEGFTRLSEKHAAVKAQVYFEYVADFAKIENAIDLFDFAESKGFSIYREFEKAILNGYRTLSEYNEGTRLGFTDGLVYRKAIKAGFESNAEYNEAQINHVNSKKEYIIYKKLKERSRNNSMDEIILLDYLNTQPNGRKIPVTKIEEHLDAELKHYCFTVPEKQKEELPQWFTRNLLSRDNIKAFLYKSPILRQTGIYDSEGEYFEIFKIRESKIFVDGSNVAHTANGKERPQMRRIWQVARALKDLRFPNIIVIADASLRHKVSDDHNKSKVEQVCGYIEAPAGTAADEFLIDRARKENGFIVTNDTFRDWKERDKWVAEHIDKIRIPFMIQKEVVTFSLEKFGEQVG